MAIARRAVRGSTPLGRGRIAVLGIAASLLIAAADLGCGRSTSAESGAGAAGSAPQAPASAMQVTSETAGSIVPPPERPIAGADSRGSRQAATLPPAARAISMAGRSPLETSPGYVPPADPESASVRLGRREAPVVAYEFNGGAPSLDDFGRAIVDGLNARDERALHAVRIKRDEFEKILWREFPQSRPITNITADDAWMLSEPKCLSAASRMIGMHGGRDLRFQRVEEESVQTFTNFVLHRGVTIVAFEPGTGEAHRIAIAPSVAERHGRFKALLFRD